MEPNAHAGASRSARDTQGPARRDPPPNSVGGGAGRGRQGSPPPHGGRAPPSPHRGGGEGSVPNGSTCEPNKYAQKWRSSDWGVRYPKAPPRTAREGFLTEGASPPPRRQVPSGAAPRRRRPEVEKEESERGRRRALGRGSCGHGGRASHAPFLRSPRALRAKPTSPTRLYPPDATTTSSGERPPEAQSSWGREATTPARPRAPEETTRCVPGAPLRTR